MFVGKEYPYSLGMLCGRAGGYLLDFLPLPSRPLFQNVLEPMLVRLGTPVNGRHLRRCVYLETDGQPLVLSGSDRMVSALPLRLPCAQTLHAGWGEIDGVEERQVL